MKMFNSADHLDRAAADVPILISAFGPKGEQVTKDLDASCAMPGGEAWAAQIEKTPESERHFAFRPYGTHVERELENLMEVVG